MEFTNRIGDAFGLNIPSPPLRRSYRHRHGNARHVVIDDFGPAQIADPLVATLVKIFRCHNEFCQNQRQFHSLAAPFNSSMSNALPAPGYRSF